MAKTTACLLLAAAAAAALIPSVALAGRSTRSTDDDDLECNYALEMFFLQDASHSYDDDIPFLREALPEFLQELLLTYPGSLFALSSFTDMPFVDVGFRAFSPVDYCWKPHTNFSDDYHELEDAVDSLRLVSGRDWAEASLSAVLHAALGNYFSPESEDYVRVIVLSTDAPPHEAGDLLKELAKHPGYWDSDTDRWFFGNVPEGDPMPVYTVKPNNGDAVLECGQDLDVLEFEDYPTYDQVGQALRDNNIFLAVLATQSVLAKWEDVAATLEGSHDIPHFVVALRDDSADILERLKEALDGIREHVCGPTTSTEVPVITATTEEPVFTGSTDTAHCAETAVLDFMLIQDVTASFKNDIPNLQLLVPNLADVFEEDFHKPRFGFVTFGDKPVRPLGSPRSEDYCFRLEAVLAENNREEIADLMADLRTRSGLDWRECQLEALLASAARPSVGWRSEDFIDGHPVMRIAAIATDAGYHKAGDGLPYGLTLTNPGTGVIDETAHDYPSVDQVVAAMKAKNVFPLFLVTKDVVPIYQKLLGHFQDAGLYGAVATILDDSQDIVDAIKEGLDELCDSSLTPPQRRLQNGSL